MVDGGTTVLVCPGDHYSLSELPNAHVTGGILATALAFSYRMLFPEFPRPTRTFRQRRAVEKLCSGVKVFLHSKKGNSLMISRLTAITYTSLPCIVYVVGEWLMMSPNSICIGGHLTCCLVTILDFNTGHDDPVISIWMAHPE